MRVSGNALQLAWTNFNHQDRGNLNMKAMRHGSIREAAATATCMLLVSLSGQAADIRSWDQKIDDANKRFVVLAAFGHQAVLDKETQLVWQRYVSNVDTTHWTAWRACAGLETGGRMGWRLPTLAELTSLVDPGVTSGAKLPAGSPFRTMSDTPIPVSLRFWSSTFDRTSPQDPASLATYRYYTLNIGTGDIEIGISAVDRNFICVRGPDPANAD